MNRDFRSILTLRSTAIAASLVLSLTTVANQAMAEGVTFADFPMVIYCEFSGISHGYYFSQLDAEGLAIYLTPDKQAAAITIDGVGHRVDGDRAGTCADKTLDDLRAAGQTFDLPQR